MLKHTNLVKGLLGVLLFSSILQVKAVESKAATVDDLKAYLGYNVEEREPEMINTESSSENEETPKRIVEPSELEEKISNLESKYIDGIRGEMTAVDLLDVLQEIKTVRGELRDSQQIHSISTIDINSLLGNSEDYTKSNEASNDLGNVNYEIGDIGEHSVSPTGKSLIIASPYGYKINNDGSHEAKKTTLDLAIGDGFDVYSQLNGKTVYIEPDTIKGASIVTLYHGNKLYTVYRHIVPRDLYIGKTIVQGDILGKSAITTEEEKDKVNHIGYQVVLDGKYINPLLLFGERGKNVYEDWVKSSYEEYSVEEGEEYYYKKSMSRENVNSKESGKNTIEGAAQVVGDYRLPDPGTVR